MTKASVQLISGFLGAGKTSFISALLHHRPNTLKVAVIINEVASIGVDGSLLSAESASGQIEIKQIAGGCICCTNGPLVRTTLIRILKDVQPDIILIEPSGLGEPSAIYRLITEQSFKNHLTVLPSICVISAASLADQRYLEHPVFKEQATFAKHWLITRIESEANTELLINKFAKTQNPNQIQFAPTLASLDQLAEAYWQQLPTLTVDDSCGIEELALSPISPRLPEPKSNQWLIQEQSHGITASIQSSQCIPFVQQDLVVSQITHLIESNTTHLWRAKGALRFSDEQSSLFQLANDKLAWQHHQITTNTTSLIAFIFAKETSMQAIQLFTEQLNAILAILKD
ncbi:hypothetical protein LIN78_00970 [Leeia sp. TBRC 13508]|uniref:CobW/HypB/UreG nucleotide-binding domain-containing protein n=1 Tax=Leeia speluncae TaxID=2884804 RepID=A0ABS8D1S0_9NEIS|nr:GTP-binding protein [Leeia speluncae]MCB6182127.1 hypothetical protein [Leeia speluncae]